MNLEKGHYGSPRWSGEIMDCSMPLTFDTYSVCSFNCLYCFSFFQRSVSTYGNYTGRKVRAVNVDKVKRLFTDPESVEPQFAKYIRERRVLQWGGLSDQFDEYERNFGKTLELLQFFREIEYPICFSTKSAWWTQDPRYMELFQGAKFWNVKFSIICNDERNAQIIEAGCPSPKERFEAMERIAKAGSGGATLRLRPFIIGLSDPDHIVLINEAARRGATAVSTEFFCVEARATPALKQRYEKISRVIGYDLLERYRQYSKGSGYLRLNRNVKRRYVREMKEAADVNGMRFYVSDAHFKECCANGSCCGLSVDWNYSRGQFTEALCIAKAKGSVHWSDIAPHVEYLKDVPWSRAVGFNTKGQIARAKLANLSMYDWIRRAWNKPKQDNSPYRYFEGVLKPVELDDNGDVVYEYDPSRSL